VPITPGAALVELSSRLAMTCCALLVLVFSSISCSALSLPGRAENPLVGRWREIAWVDCESGEEMPPDDPIRELRFQADGTVTVTWHPIETYVDYQGDYQLSDAGAIEIAINWSAYAPADFDGTGTVQLDEAGDLLLGDLWLGSPRQARGLDGCGHRFERVE